MVGVHWQTMGPCGLMWMDWVQYEDVLEARRWKVLPRIAETWRFIGKLRSRSCHPFEPLGQNRETTGHFQEGPVPVY